MSSTTHNFCKISYSQFEQAAKNNNATES